MENRPAPGENPHVVIMILNWNSGEHLARCLSSVLSTVSSDIRIIVLDNGSTDGSLDVARAAGPRVEVLEFGENLGFAAAYNAGIYRATEDFVILLNPDTKISTAGWASEALSIAIQDDSTSAVAMKLVFADDSTCVNSAGATAYWWSGAVDIGFGERDRGQYDRAHRPFAASGGAMLVRRNHFLEVGGFDEAMFAYDEDVDLSWRVRLRGGRVAYSPGSVVMHAFSVSVGPLSPLHIYLTHRNYLRAMLKNYAAWTLVRGLPAYALWTGVRVAWALMFQKSTRLASAPLRAIGWNLVMLRDTIRARRLVQPTRVVGDREIMRAMGPRGFESFASLRRRLEVVRARPEASV